MIVCICQFIGSGEVKDEDVDADVEWEDVGGSGDLGSLQPGLQQLARSDTHDNEGNPLPAWRIRMARRQRFWSTSHGFKVCFLQGCFQHCRTSEKCRAAAWAAQSDMHVTLKRRCWATGCRLAAHY